MNLLENIRTSVLCAKEKSVNIWNDTPFSDLYELTPDERGFVGEKIFYNCICSGTKYRVVWDGDTNINQLDGTYDMKINEFRVEIKSALRGTKSNTWQHDHIHKNFVYDKLVFVDIDPDGIYFTILNHSQMTFEYENPIFGKKATPCKGGWKFDMSSASLKKGIDNGVTFFYNVLNESDHDEKKFSSFLTRNFERLN